MKITTYVDPTLADGYSSVEGLSPDDFTPAPDFMPEGSNSYYGANGDEFYNSDGETYSYIDQNNKTEVKAFQDFVIKVKKDSTILGSAGADGIWGTKTQKAYDKYGADWEDYKKKALGVMGAFLNIPSSSASVPTTAPAVSGEPTPAQVEEQKKKGLFWDKAKKTWVSAKELGLVDYVLDVFGVAPKEETPAPKKLSNTAKTILYVGGALVVGLIIYSIAKRKKGA